ncbi:MAG: hypothetical protein LBL86_10650 [Coriobacteriales bacterium]|nr:hypothetical protein [Coriobacteriales bacterium]
MEVTKTRLSLKNRVIAVLLAALMVMGVSFALPSVAQAGVTDEPMVWNPEDTYTIPDGGMFTFESSGFDPERPTVTAKPVLEPSVVLGVYEVDEDGVLRDPDNPERTTFIVPLDTAPTLDFGIVFYYGEPEDPWAPNFATGLFLTVIANQYHPDFEYDGSTTPQTVSVTNENDASWGAGRHIYVKYDFHEAVYVSFFTDASGFFDEVIDLPLDMTPGYHAVTLLAFPETIDSVFYPQLSVSYTFSVS